MICDRQGERRGLRRRPVTTKLFVAEGAIRLLVGDEVYDVACGEEFHVGAAQWHGWIAQNDCKVLQQLEHYDEQLEERKDF